MRKNKSEKTDGIYPDFRKFKCDMDTFFKISRYGFPFSGSEDDACEITKKNKPFRF